MSPFSPIDYFPSTTDADDSSSISASTVTCASPLHHSSSDDDSLPSTTSSTRSAVSFDDCVEVNFVLHHKDFTIAEKSASWYNGDEIRSIKNGVRAAVQILTNTPNAPETLDYTPRGIEDRTREAAKAKRQHKIDARAAVFFEQSCQQDEDGFVDDEMLADCYYDYSEPSSIKAHMIALRDEKDAKAIYQECQKTIRDSLIINVGGIETPVVEEEEQPVIASSAA